MPACEMASRAYSTWYRRPSGEKMVVCLKIVSYGRASEASLGRLTLESYLRDMVGSGYGGSGGKQQRRNGWTKVGWECGRSVGGCWLMEVVVMAELQASSDA